MSNQGDENPTVQNIVFEASHELPLVSVSLSFAGGAVHEGPNEGGLARVVGRMLRRGADGMSSEQIEAAVDALGGELAIDVGLGVTSVYFECLTRSAERLAALVGRLLSRPTFAEDELGRLLRQTEAEIASARDDDAFLAARAFRRRMFHAHPHGRRVGGTIESVRSLGRAAVAGFHAAHFTRSNVVVGVSGDVGDAEARRLVDLCLTELPVGQPTAYPAGDPEPLAGRHVVFVDKPERTQSQMVLGTLGSHPADDDHIALIVANTAFGGTMSSRLFQEVRGKRGWSYGASSSVGFSRVREAFSMWTAPAAVDAAPCLALELELLDGLCRTGVTEAELEHAKCYLRRSYAFEIDTARKRVGQAVGRQLLGLPDDYHDRYLERVAAVTPAGANEALRLRLDPGSLCVGLVGTAADIADDVMRAVPDIAEMIRVPFDIE